MSYVVNELFSVKGKTCIVTGGGSGIGKAMATALAVNGAKVIIVGRRIAVLEATAADINALAKESQQGGEAIPIQGDVGNKAGVVEFYEKAIKVIDKLDYLVNNAGFSSNWKVQGDWNNEAELEAKLWSIEDVDWNNMTGIHVGGPYYLGVKFIPLFKKSESPSICNITSLGAFFLNRAVCEFSYCQSKAAETHLTQMMAAAFMPMKIRVNTICPGLFPSELTTDASGEFFPPMKVAINNIPLRRPGTYQEMAGPVLMLATKAGGYLNAAEIIIDGGWKMTASANDI